MISKWHDAPGSESASSPGLSVRRGGTARLDRRRCGTLPQGGGVHLLIIMLAVLMLAGCDLKDLRDAPTHRRHGREADAADAVDAADTIEASEPAEAGAGAKRTAAVGTDSIRIFFSNTYAGTPEVGEVDTANIDRHCAAFISTARRTLDCAFFELESDRIAAALIAARR